MIAYQFTFQAINMSRYYVISPNVKNDGNISDYLKQMFQTHTIMMGWSPQEPKGRMFDRTNHAPKTVAAKQTHERTAISNQ